MTDTETHKANQKLLAMITRNPPARQSWRDVLPIHPAANLFPLMSEYDPQALRELAGDINTNHLQVPLILWTEKAEDADNLTKVQLLDGRNRLDGLELLGVQLVRRGKLDLEAICMFANTGHFVEKRFGGDPYELVLSLNAHRRHLASGQKRAVIAKVLKARPEKSNRQIASELGHSHVTVGAVRDELASTGQIDQLEKTKGKDGKFRKKPATEPTTTPIRPDSAAPTVTVGVPSTTDPLKALAESWHGVEEQIASGSKTAPKPKAEQKSFDSPEEAPKAAPKPSKQEMKALSDSWFEVYAQIKAGNRTRLKDALENHRGKIDRILEGLRS